MQFGLVILGSSLGGLARWGIGTASVALFGKGFPYGTMFINLAGSFFLGWLATVLTERLIHHDAYWLKPEDIRLLLAVGFAGAFTTFSTFEYEAHGLLKDGDGLAAMTYVFGSVFLGLLALRGGILLAQRW